MRSGDATQSPPQKGAPPQTSRGGAVNFG